MVSIVASTMQVDERLARNLMWLNDRSGSSAARSDQAQLGLLIARKLPLGGISCYTCYRPIAEVPALTIKAEFLGQSGVSKIRVADVTIP